MKVIAFAQLRNEARNGNLGNWLRSVEQCDELYIYDQDSDDNSADIYAEANAHVIYSPTNQFTNELVCKQRLLQKILDEQLDAEWIVWLDGDTLLDGRLLKKGLHNYLAEVPPDVDGLLLGHYNLWRSDVWYRTDSKYHGLHRRGRCALWRVQRPNVLKFPAHRGLHHRQWPDGFRCVKRSPYAQVHRGFATNEQIWQRYAMYASMGQMGPKLDRLIDEQGLTVERLPEGALPEWFQAEDTQDPRTKVPLCQT